MITRRPVPIPYAPIECVGPIQARLLDRAASSSHHYVMPSGRERKAAARLTSRGLLTPAPGLPGVLAVTPYANNCNWLVNR